MENTTYAGRLRYLGAEDVDDAVVSYDGLDVSGPDGKKLGSVDGFIVDAEARRVTSIVVDSGGWFATRRLLLPIGHASLAADRRSLQVDVTPDALRRFPEYDEDRFRAFTDDELRAFERNTVVACCPDEPLEDVSVTTWGYDTWRHYTPPDWSLNIRYAPEGLRPIGQRASRRFDPTVPIAVAGMPAAPAPETRNRDLVTASDDRLDDSPHFDGRAQPGDVIGVETGGERTGIGETAEDEDARRREAEATADSEPRRSER